MVDERAKDILLQGSKTGVLVLHGFTSSPSYMHPIGEALNQAGYSVYVPRLPGHGTDVRDMARYGCPEWCQAARQAGQVLLDMGCEKVFCLGHSLGGVLALYLAEEHLVDGIVTLAAPYYIFRYWRIRLFSRFCPKSLRPMGSGREQEGGFRYSKTTGKSVGDLLDTMKTVHNRLGEVECPALIISCSEDKTVIPSSAQHIHRYIGSENKQYLPIRAPHQCTLDHLDLYLDQVLRFLQNNC